MAKNIKVTFYNDVSFKQFDDKTATPLNGNKFDEGGIYFTAANNIASSKHPAHIVHNDYIYTLGSYVINKEEKDIIIIDDDTATNNEYVVTSIDSNPYNKSLTVNRRKLQVSGTLVTGNSYVANLGYICYNLVKSSISLDINNVPTTIYFDSSYKLCVTTSEVEITGVNVVPESYTFNGTTNTTYRLSATVLPTNVSSDKKNVTWKSADIAYVTVDGTGLIKALQPTPDTGIRVSAYDITNKHYDFCTVFINEGQVTSITIKTSSTTLTSGGGDIKFTPTVTHNKFGQPGTINWIVDSDLTIDEVDGNSVKINFPANTSTTSDKKYTVKATCENKSATVTITVKAKTVETKYYWYVGTSNPAELTPPNVKNETLDKWTLISSKPTEIAVYKTDENWDEHRWYIAIPEEYGYSIYDNANNNITSQFTKTSDTIAGVKYAIYQTMNLMDTIDVKVK